MMCFGWILKLTSIRFFKSLCSAFRFTTFWTRSGKRLRIISKVIHPFWMQCKYPYLRHTPTGIAHHSRIMFMHEYKIIDAAVSVEQLRLRLKDNELEQYGDAFIPEYVYNVIKQMPRFSAMRVSFLRTVSLGTNLSS
jgi:hypothetical protein